MPLLALLLCSIERSSVQKHRPQRILLGNAGSLGCPAPARPSIGGAIGRSLTVQAGFLMEMMQQLMRKEGKVTCSLFLWIADTCPSKDQIGRNGSKEERRVEESRGEQRREGAGKCKEGEGGKQQLTIHNENWTLHRSSSPPPLSLNITRTLFVWSRIHTACNGDTHFHN